MPAAFKITLDLLTERLPWQVPGRATRLVDQCTAAIGDRVRY
jgi:hypothetical protein